MDPKKLALHFSDFSVIFYAIYKNQELSLTIGVTFLQSRPWKEFDVCNVAPGAAGRRGWPNSGEAARFLAGEWQGKGLGLLGAWFGCLDRVEVAPARGSSAAREGRPQEVCSGEVRTGERE
jgi:hypothetical protein